MHVFLNALLPRKESGVPPHASRPPFCISSNVDSAERSQPLSEIDGFHTVARKHFSFVREGKEKYRKDSECYKRVGL